MVPIDEAPLPKINLMGCMLRAVKAFLIPAALEHLPCDQTWEGSNLELAFCLLLTFYVQVTTYTEWAPNSNLDILGTWISLEPGYSWNHSLLIRVNLLLSLSDRDHSPTKREKQKPVWVK